MTDNVKDRIRRVRTQQAVDAKAQRSNVPRGRPARLSDNALLGDDGGAGYYSFNSGGGASFRRKKLVWGAGEWPK